MYFRALAADYDGTLALHGAVDDRTVQALRAFREGGRRLVLVTGREVAELRHVMPELTLFDRVVAENGGVLLDPATGSERVLAPGPPPALVQSLMERGVAPMSVGRTIIATWQPHEPAVLAAIAELGLDHQIIFNKDAVMVLPPGVNKATGLATALRELDLSAANVVGVGDAENDRAFLAACGGSAAVANAVTSLKEASDLTMSADHGLGVVELIERIMRDDARLVSPARRGVLLGNDKSGKPAWLTAQESLLIVGGSGSGKSRFVTLLIERMIDRVFDVCVLDPEGEYEALEDAIAIGDESHAGSVTEAVRLLSRGLNVAVSTVAINLDDRRCLFERLVTQILSTKETRGRPHWLIVDEAHHYLPSSCSDTGRTLASAREGLVLATMDPDWLPRKAVTAIDHVLAFGSTAAELLSKCGAPAMSLNRNLRLSPDEALLWSRGGPAAFRVLQIDAPRHGHERHRGKYALGDVGDNHSFYFGPGADGMPHRAHNLAEFLSEMEVLSDEAWMHHLRNGDFTAWFLHVIRDDELGRRAQELAVDENASPAESRVEIAAAIRARYTIPSASHG